MQAFLLTSLLAAAAFAAPSAEPKADPYGFYGHHLYHGPPCKHAFVEETKEVCHIEPEKVCKTKTRTYKVITGVHMGYKDGECKEIEVCKFPGFHHGKRPAEPHGYVELSVRRRPRRCARRRPPVDPLHLNGDTEPVI